MLETPATGGSGMDQWQAPDVRQLQRIGGGVSADVFLLPPDRVLKLLLPGLSAVVAEREFAAARLAHAMGLPVPAPITLAWTEATEATVERHGMVFERLVESSVARRLRRMPGPVMATLAAMARFQARAHALAPPAGSLPSAHDLLGARCDDAVAPAAVRLAAQRRLAQLGHGDRLLHGDLHLGNVITSAGRLMVVDWAQAMMGDPAADVARTELLMRFGRYGASLRRHAALRAARHAAADWYLLCYRSITGMPAAAIDAWRLPTAVAWMRAGSAAHAPSLAAYAEQRLR